MLLPTVQHDTALAWLDLLKVGVSGFFGVASSGGTVAWLHLLARKRQNEALTTGGMKLLKALQADIGRLDASYKDTQNMVAILQDKLKDGNLASTQFLKKMDEMETIVIRGEDLISKFNDYLARAKSGTLIEKQIAPGVTKITGEEEK